MGVGAGRGGGGGGRAFAANWGRLGVGGKHPRSLPPPPPLLNSHRVPRQFIAISRTFLAELAGLAIIGPDNIPQPRRRWIVLGKFEQAPHVALHGRRACREIHGTSEPSSS